MNDKQIVGIIALILMLPTLVSLLVFSATMGFHTPEENTEAAANMLANAATPWWIGLVETLSKWGTFGAIILIIFFLLIKKYPELR